MLTVGRPPAGAGAAAAARRLHGRRRGKALRAAQAERLARMLPRLELPAGPAPLDPAALFPGRSEVWLEIGFGGGEHLHTLACARPEVGFIGCEPFVNGVATLLGKLAAADPGNVRIHPGDARDVIDRLPASSLGRVYLLYPDPWPKKRHHKRRFARPEQLAALAGVMAPGAELRFATDIADYAEAAAAAAAAVDLLEPVVAGPPGWHRAWPGWTGTRYEAKALRQGRRPHYLVFRRRRVDPTPRVG